MKSTWDYKTETARFEDEPDDFLQDYEFCAECGMTYLPHTMKSVEGFYHKKVFICDECLHGLMTSPDNEPGQWSTDPETGIVTYKYKRRGK